MRTIRASKEGIEKAKQACAQKQYTQLQIATRLGISRGTVVKFFRGKEFIKEDNFREICKFLELHYDDIVGEYNHNHQYTIAISPSVYDPDSWVGREQETTQLSAKMQGECRLLILTGITGIGKTALAERLAIELQKDWTKFERVNFDDEEDLSDFNSVAARLLTLWGETVTADDRKNTQGLLQRLVGHLQENRYLLVINSLEFILKGNENEGWSDFKDEWWLRFLKNLLTIESFQSRLILTTQDIPQQLEQEGSRLPIRFYCQPLGGLSDTEQLDFFHKMLGLDISIDSLDKTYLVRAGKAYEGHPLALRVIIGEILVKPYYGNVVAYWNKYGHEIEEVEKALEEAKTQAASADDNWQLHSYSRDLKIKVQSRLERTFNRLKNDVYYAYALLCEASVFRCAVEETWWLELMEDWDFPKDWDQDKCQQVLDTLKDRYLIEEEVTNNQPLLRQHNLIRSVALAHLKKLTWNNE